MRRALEIALGAVVFAAIGGVLALILYVVMGDDAPTAPTPAPSVPSGYEVDRVRVGDRDVWCVSRYNGGVSCDFTREAS